MSEVNGVAVQELSLPSNFGRTLTPEEEQKVKNLVKMIDIHDSYKVAHLGEEPIVQIGKYADTIIKGVSTSQMGEAGDLLTEALSKVNGFSIDVNKKQNGLLSFFKKKMDKLKEMQTQYRSVSENIDIFTKKLHEKQLELEKLSREFDNMYKINLATYRFLSLLIYAGDIKIEEEKERHLQLKEDADLSGDLMKIQEANNFYEDILRFERKLYDMKVSRMIALQTAPQIKTIQKSANMLADAIRSNTLTTMVLWKNNMALALGMQSVKTGVNALNSVRETTNQLLIANSQMNKTMTIEAAKASERGIVDIETINTINNNLIEALNSANEIAQKAVDERNEGTKQLQDKEAELKEIISKLQN